jgi:sugar lactone lactonase YvrE
VKRLANAAQFLPAPVALAVSSTAPRQWGSLAACTLSRSSSARRCQAMLFATLLVASPSATVLAGKVQAQWTEATTGTSTTVIVTTPAVPFSAKVGSLSAPQTVTFTFNAAATLGSTAVLTAGAEGLDFTVEAGGTCKANTAYAKAKTCTVKVSFKPLVPGPRSGAVVLYNTSKPGVALATAYLSGIASGPAVTFRPGIASTVSSSGLLTAPTGVAVDGAGNIYVADFGSNLNPGTRVYKIDPKTQSSIVVAGNGKTGFSGDKGPATSAELSSPADVAIDGAGNLYISDIGNGRVRKVDASTGIITTVAGSGSPGTGGDGAAATKAQLTAPYGLAIDGAGDLYIGDEFSDRVRMVSAATGFISTVAGNSTNCVKENDLFGDGCPALEAELDSPTYLALDASNNLYITDENHGIVRIVMASTQVISRFAGGGHPTSSTKPTTPNGDGGPATAAYIDTPGGIALDAAGNLYLSDSYDARIRVVNGKTGIISTIAGTGVLGDSGDGGSARSAEFYVPEGIALDPAGNVYVTDVLNANVRELDFADPPELTFPATNTGSVSAAQNIAVDNVGNAPLTIDAISVPAAFTLGGTNTSCSTTSQVLAPAISCTLGIEFAPKSAGTSAAKLELTDNALNDTRAAQFVELSGVGKTAAPVVVLTPTKLIFTATKGATSPAQKVTVKNTGKADLTISSIELSGIDSANFKQTNDCTKPVAEGKNCTISVVFEPTSVASFSAKLSLADNAKASPQAVSLSGTGTAAK